MMWPVAAMASAVKAGRKPAASDNPFRRLEDAGSEMITASLNLYRDLRDAASESVFFQIYGSMIALGASGDVKFGQPPVATPDPRQLPFVKTALAAIEKGGYTEAIARIWSLVGQYADVIPLQRLEMADRVLRSDEKLSKLSEDEMRRLRSDAEVVALLEPERTLRSLPLLLAKPEDKKRALSLVELVQSQVTFTQKQQDMVGKITAVLSEKKAGAVAGNTPRKKAKKK